MTPLTVAIINYNTREHLLGCLASLPGQVRGDPLQVIVIDNASVDGSMEAVRARFAGRFELVSNRTNMGFARAINQALQLSQAPYLLVLNADTEVRDRALEALLDFMEATPRAGLAGGKLLDPAGEIQPSCRRFYTLGAILLRRTPLGRLYPHHPALRRHLMLDWDHASARVVDWVQGACLMLRRTAVAEVGPMDERFFLYFEDVDLCRRMAEGAWVVYYLPTAEFVHHYQRTSQSTWFSRAKLHHLASALRYLIRWQVRPRLEALAPRWRRCSGPARRGDR